MGKTTLLAIVVMFAMITTTAEADFYKYIDKNGNIVFTDDLSTVPKDQRKTAEKYDAPPPSTQNDESVEVNNQPESDAGKGQISTSPKEDLNKKKEELEQKQALLEKEYESLMKDKEDLEKEKAQAKGHQKIKEYNEKVLKFSEKLDNYNKKRTALEKEVAEYNTTVEKLNEQSQK